MYRLTNYWHNFLDMPKHNRTWHQNDMNEEYQEYLEEKNIIKKWSELSDLVYTHSRSCWSGHKLRYPLNKKTVPLGLIYMYPKYTLRYTFYRKAGHIINQSVHLKEVRNPRKTYKLHEIAKKYDLDEKEFTQTCQQLLKRWILIP